MRIIAFLLGASLVISCGTATKQPKADGGNNVKNAPALTTPVTPEGVGAHLEFLSSDALEGRDTGSEGIDRAASYIAGHFEQAGVKPFYPKYRDTLENYQGYAANVVGYLEGTDPELKNEWVVIGAHYDHIGKVKAEKGDSIANGANDNASGTVAVMEIARKMAAVKDRRRSVLFALFTAEEKGLKGSAHLAKRLMREGRKVYTVINFEMLGVPMTQEYLVYMTGYEMSNLAEMMNEMAGESLVGLLPKAKEYQLFKRSDNYPFFKTYGVPAHTFSTFDFTNFGYYHKAGDEYSLMDTGHMANVIERMLPLVEGVVNSDAQAVHLKDAEGLE